ncbi:MAG: 4-alpha-glucanotransferase, partial [Candidatus Omnitrophota bacterium]
ELGLNPKENPQDKETARKISLVLAGQMKFEDADIKGLDPHMVSALSQWLNTVSDAFIEGYLDEVEAQGIQGNLLKGEWNREKAKFLIYYWVVARAFHELRYEVYARDEGWEAIPGARILQIVQDKLGVKASVTALDAAERPLTYATSPLQVVDNPPAQNRFFAPIDAGRREDVIFFPFQHMRGATNNPWDERFDWGNGDYIVAKSAIDFCKLMGIPIMQILPDRWSAAFHSPYSVLGNAVADPENINIPSVVATMQKNGIDAKDVVSFINENMSKIEGLRQSLTIDHELIFQLKIQSMKKAWESFKNSKDAEMYHSFESYEARQKGEEVEDDVFFYLMKEAAMQKDGSKGWDWRLWTKWFPGLIGKNRFVIETMKNAMREDLRFHLFVQFFLEKQDNEFKQYADANNVSVMIDIPFAPPDATVFFNPELVSMDGQENQFQRVEVQGVPGKKETPLGQLWNFSIYRDRNVMEGYFKKTFQQNQKRGVKFVRRDHVPGDFQVYAFRQDVKEEFRLDRLGIIDQINAIREAALQANTPEAKSAAGRKIGEMIKSTLMHPPAGIAKLPQDIIDLLFTPDGDMRTEGNMLMIARKSINGQKPPQGSLWTQVDQMEDGIFADAPKWDLLRITPNKRADDIGFIGTWLFPEDNVPGPLPTDSIRVAYYKAGPGESILQEMDYLAQREGNSVVLETLGTVTNDMLASSQRPGGYPLIPLIWGLDSKGRYHPTKYQANNFAVYDVPDSQTPISAWEAESIQTKTEVLKLLKADVNENLARPTPAVYEQLLSMVMAPRKVFSDLPVENVPLLAGLSLQAYLMLDDNYRLNSPGHQISWFRALPHEASLQSLLTAASGQKSSTLAQDGVERIKRLRQARYEDEPQINPNEVKILNTRPNTNWSSVAVRRIDSNHPQDTDPFLVEAAISGLPKSVTFVEIDRYGKELSRVAMQEMKGQKGHVEGVGDWMVSLRPTGLGIYRYIIEAERADGSFARSKTGLLVAAGNNTDLNYISGNFLKNVDDFRNDKAEKSKALKNDNAVLTDGGINFDPAMMDMQTVRQGSGFAEIYGQPDLLKVDIQGLTPMIIGVKAAVNMPSLLGFSLTER